MKMIKRKALILQLKVRMHSWLLFLGPLPHRWTWAEDVYSVWSICDGSRVCMYSSNSYTEYAMSFTDFLPECLLWSKPTVMPFWTILPCNTQQCHPAWHFLVTFKNLHYCQWNAQAETRIDVQLWVRNYHLKPLSPAIKRFKQDGNG